MDASRTHGIVLPPSVRAMLERHPLTSRLHPTHYGVYVDARGGCARPEGFDTHILILCTGGRGYLTFDGRERPVSAGHLLLIPERYPHGYGSAPGRAWSLYWSHFSGSASADYFGGLKTPLLSRPPAAVFNRALAVFRDYHACLCREMTMSALILASQWLGCLLAGLFFPDISDSGAETGDGVERAVRFMEANIGRALSLAEMSARSGYSKPHFLSLFKKRTGFSPVEYFNHMKIRRACHLLGSASHNIAEISAMTGIENQHYFSRLFSKIMGVPPSSYRKSLGWRSAGQP